MTLRTMSSYAGGAAAVVFAMAVVVPARGEGASEAVPFAQGQALRLVSIERPVAGQLAITFALENPTNATTTLAGDNFRGWQDSRCPAVMVTARGGTAAGLPTDGQSVRDCAVKAISSGQGVRYRVVVGDPGGASVDIFPGGGLPFYDVPVPGDPSPASDLLTFEPKTSRPGPV